MNLEYNIAEEVLDWSIIKVKQWKTGDFFKKQLLKKRMEVSSDLSPRP